MPRAVLSSRRDAGGGLLLVTLDVDESAARTYIAPGQYVEVRAERESGYFVLASEVGRSPWEILFRHAGDAADILASRGIGASVELSSPIGVGFPPERTDGRSLVVAVVASALGAARALVGLRVATPERPPTFVLLGVRDPADVPLADEVHAWVARGVNVVLCSSRREGDRQRELPPGLANETGWVQHVLARAVEEGRIPRNAVVAAAGPEGMVEDLERLVELMSDGGRPALELLSNIGER